MKTILLSLATFVAFVSCENKKTQPPVEVPEFDSSLVRPISDSVASLYRSIQ